PTPDAQRAGSPGDSVLVDVSAGDALDPAGREISLRRAARVDLAHEDALGHCVIVSGDTANPFAAGATTVRRSGGTYLLAVCFDERPDRYVPSPTGPKPDGSDTPEATVIRDSYAFALLAADDEASATAQASGWVVLGTITNYGQTGMTITEDDRA